MNYRWLAVGILVLVLVGTVSAGSYQIYPYHDGYLYETGNNATWETLVGGAGSSVGDNSTSAVYLAWLAAGKQEEPPGYAQNYRSGNSWDTSIIPDDETIDSAKIVWKYYGRQVTLGGTMELALVGFDPAGIPYVAGDYNNNGTVELSDRLDWSGISSGNINVTLNAAGLAYINKTGNTSFMTMNADELDGANSVVWGASLVNRIYAYPANHATFENKPYLLIETSSSTPPTAAFSCTPLFGSSPLSVTCTDASTETPTSWEWYYSKDGGADTLFNSTSDTPIQEFTNGTYDIKLNATNAGGSDWENKSYHLYAYGLEHPIMINESTIPGVVNAGIEPWNDNRTRIIAQADLYMSHPFESDNISVYNTSFQNPILYFAYAYQITGDTNYANKTVDALKNVTWLCNTDSMASMGDVGDLGLAYDLIHKTYGTNSTLDGANNTIIRDRLASYAERCYESYNASSSRWIMEYHGGVAYTWIASIGEALADYTNTSMDTTPEMWRVLGGEGLWGGDPLHDYETGTVSKVNMGDMWQAADYVSGADIVGEYTLNWPVVFQRWANVWSNIHGTNYLEEYPQARNYALFQVWQPDPMGYNSMENTGKPAKRFSISGYDALFNDTEKAWSKWAVARSLSAPAYYGASTKSYHSGTENVATVGSAFQYYYVPNTSTITPAAPSYTSNLQRNASYQTFRSGWDTNDTWLRFVAYPEPMSNRAARFHGAHIDQLTFDLFALGDQLMADAGEYNTFGLRDGINHNSILIDNGTVPFPLQFGSFFSGGNITYLAASRGAPLNATYNEPSLPVLEEKYLVQSPSMELMSFGINNISLATANVSGGEAVIGADYTYYTTSPINETRIVLYPFKDYIIVVDRMESGREFGFYNNFRFTSYNIVSNTSPDPSAENGYYGLQRVNGSLAIGGIPYNWESQNISVENNTGITTNTILWNTTNHYNKNVTLNLFTSPESPTAAINHMSKLGQGTDGGIDLNKNPQVLFKPELDTTLYRVTALLTGYSSDAARTPSELTVTGTGSAIKVIGADTVNTDRIYTGLGNSSFDGFDTDADTVFIRTNETDTYALIVNGSYLAYNSTDLIANASVQDYIEFQGDPLDFGEGEGEGVPPTANFTGTPTSGNAPLTVTFTDTSDVEDATGYNWSFGDNEYNETADPVHIYATFGSYNVNMTVTNASGSDYELKSGYITVYNTTPVANFTKNYAIVRIPKLFIVNDTSTNTPSSWSWTFGEGTTATTNNATHEYIRPGTFNVALNVSNDGGYNITSQKIRVVDDRWWIYMLTPAKETDFVSIEDLTYTVSRELTVAEKEKTESKLFNH